MKLFVKYILIFALFMMVGCNPLKNVKTDDDLADYDAEQVINLATDAYVDDKYDVALYYYHYVLDHFPDDKESLAWANYEIGFIHHVLNDDETAIQWFEKVLLIDTESLAPQILAVNMIDKLSEDADAVTKEKEMIEKELEESGGSDLDFSSDFYDQEETE